MGGKINILHIEDDHCYSKMFQIQLNRVAIAKSQYELVFDVAPSATIAYQKLDENKYDCIISDYQILKGNGLDVLEEVKKRELDIPFIFLTGQGDERVAREAFVQGANDYFTKDITIADYDRIYNSIKNQITLFETRRMQKEHEVRYQTLFEHCNAALILIDEDTTILLANPEMERLSRYTKAELENKMSWTEFVSKEDVERMKKYHYARRCGERNVPNIYNFHLIDKEGNEKYLYLSVVMIPNTKKISGIHDRYDKTAECNFRS